VLINDTEPLWLRSNQVKGRDHLGIQIVSMAVYAELLPGLTNVTDRVRYYSFYPWVLHRYATDVRLASDRIWYEHIRRADFLLALVARAHHLDDPEGGEAMVGSKTARNAVKRLRQNPSTQRPISSWSYLPQKGRKRPYFQNKEGGLGQYYKASLAELRLMDFGEEPPGVRLVRGSGTQLAELCDKQPGRDQFWQAVINDRISFRSIQRLGDQMCPCALPSFAKERDFLRQLLFGTTGQIDAQTLRRARTLRLLLSYLSHFHGSADPWDWELYRQTAYFGHNAIGKRFVSPSDLNDTLQKWAIYQAGEYVNRALEEIFLAVLWSLKSAACRVDTFAADFAKDVLSLCSNDLGVGRGKTQWRTRQVSELLSEAARNQGRLRDWSTALWSEHRLITQAALEPDARRRAALSFACILSVLARPDLPSDPYAAFQTIASEFWRAYPVNLTSVRALVFERKSDPSANVLSDLVRQCILYRHLRVAMHKLRFQNDATFKFVVEYGHYGWLEDFDPTYTSPRLRQAFRFIRDLGLAKGRSGNWQLTADGRAFLRNSNVHETSDIPRSAAPSRRAIRQ
jgi:hypothetical protein